MHGPRVEHPRLIGARKKIGRINFWSSDLKILRSHLKTLRSSRYATKKWECGTGDSKNMNFDTGTSTISKGSQWKLIAAENGPPECGCPDPLRNRSPDRRGLQISFHHQSLSTMKSYEYSWSYSTNVVKLQGQWRYGNDRYFFATTVLS